MESKILAVIPARAGSKGLPGKNQAKIGGRSLTEIAVLAAKNSKHVTHVCVTTDSVDIQKSIEDLGVPVPWLRDASLSGDEASTFDTVLDALTREANTHGPFDLVVLLEPTAPLRYPSDVDTVIEIILSNIATVDACITVSRVNFHPSAVQKIDTRSGYLIPYSEHLGEIRNRRQDGAPAYLPIGNCFAIKVGSLLSEKTFYAERCRPLILEPHQSIEIDDDFDLQVASFLWGANPGESQSVALP